MTDSRIEAEVGPADDEIRRSGRRRAGSPGRAGERGRSGSSGFGDGGRGGRFRRRDDAPDAEPPADDEMADPEAVARGICLRALTGTAKTRQQLAELLAKKHVPVEAAEAVLDRFTEVGLIDDAAFAAAWVSSRQSGRGLARRALASELRARGVDGDVAAAAVAEVDPQDEWDTARRLVQRKAPGMRRLDRSTAERRLIGMLARKGYGGGLAGIVVREALDELHAGAADDEAGDREGGAAHERAHDADGPAGTMAAEVGEGHWVGIGRPAARPGGGLTRS